MDSSPQKFGSQLFTESIEQQAERTPRPSLLPAFEESSPFPRPNLSKRKFEDDSPPFPKQQLKYYPTPVPTSSTGILHSSSPQNARSGILHRTVSALSERTPLGAVPTVNLPADGEIVRMGRSSNSADYQLSTNRLISRVHVQAAYHAPTAHYPSGNIEVECLGWNGAKIHCRGCVFELNKGDTYMSENPEIEILLDVQDTRVIIAWPSVAARKLSWDSEEEGMPTPTRRTYQEAFNSSPPAIPRSPVSQSPIRQPLFSQPVFTGHGLTAPSVPVQVFEDVDVQEEAPIKSSPDSAERTFIRPDIPYSAISPESPAIETKASILSSFTNDDYSDGDEENDPVVHSFGPFGQNLVNGLASFSTALPGLSNSPRPPRVPLMSPSPKRPCTEGLSFKESPIKNHVINQLAFSRIHAQPLSAIHSNLPSELKISVIKSSKGKDTGDGETSTAQLTHQDLKKILDDTPCVGEIPRAGKDAAGKPLENEFYYVPEMDSNQMRRETITAGMRSTGLRTVRRTHKQYYWKKPRV
ncbi:hypothetical protein P153DRAFT_358464 [Dothidotthia symphoricarpi CBS 119687]|uniref:FHA domain-containing protein n=1 Tax=Dothidotthia symphoricarpi CBS 119687 TaxID=1392245 RepID=A0A6A6A6H7_9PLEO|nr:uncharacterized protein P153DRAFT_358464 [Dothidotthia symphoricarpi CBS 119687]KAF2127592.1 hypothetical protein P153DRAFT_358464 [Dothidotthia symphoricarpi CBS 119687]